MKKQTTAIVLACVLTCSGIGEAPARAGSIPEPTAVTICPATVDMWVMDGYYKRGDCTCPSTYSEPVCTSSASSGRSSGYTSVPKKKHSNPNAQLSAYVTGLVVQELLTLAFAPPASNSAAEEQARAQAEWEQQQRLLQEKKERALTAGRLREGWDRRDQEISDSLGDMFAAPTPRGAGSRQSTETTGHTVRLLGTGAPDAPLPVMARSTAELTAIPSSLQEEILNQGAASAPTLVWELLKETAVKAFVPERWKNAKLAVEHVDKVQAFTGDLFTALEAENLAAAAASERPEDSLRIIDAIDGVTRQASTLGMTNNPFSSRELEVGYKLLHDEEVTTEDLKTIAGDHTKSYFMDKLSSRLLKGSL